MQGVEKTITIIAAVASNQAIGFVGRMPWHLPAELQHFKETTMGKAIVMGRRTWESIGRALPGRQSIVVSRNSGYVANGCQMAGSLAAAIAIAEGSEVMVIGGGELYRQALPLARRMILTVVDCAPEADTWFPQWDRSMWRLVSRRDVSSDEKNPLSYQVQEWLRTSPAWPSVINAL
jgi:dihydrofolate reductase